MHFYKHAYFNAVNLSNSRENTYPTWPTHRCFVCGKRVNEYAYISDGFTYLQQNICVGICTKQCFDVYQLTPMVLDDYLKYYGHSATRKRSKHRYPYAVY